MFSMKTIFAVLLSLNLAYCHLQNYKESNINIPNKKSGLNKEVVNTLVLTNVLVRHGNRVPEVASAYPTNPVLNISLYPYSVGDLTRKGQARLYNVGKALRYRYGDFLGDVYFTDLAKSTVNSYARCQMSLQALHAGLFHSNTMNPVPGLSWQAVPYTIIPFKEDKLISVHKTCDQYLPNLTYPEITDEEQKKVFESVRENSGFDNNITLYHMFQIYDFTKTSYETNLPIPEWIKSIYPEPLATLNMQFWNLVQQQKKKIGAGFLLRKITEDLIAKANGSLLPKDRKMFLYSGHDINLHVMRGALNVWTPETINYGAYIIFELHKINEQYGVKIYFNNQYDKSQLLTIPGCKSFCPLNQFIELTKYVYEPEPVCY